MITIALLLPPKSGWKDGVGRGKHWNESRQQFTPRSLGGKKELGGVSILAKIGIESPRSLGGKIQKEDRPMKRIKRPIVRLVFFFGK